MSDKVIASDVCPRCGGEFVDETLSDPFATGHVWTEERFDRIESCSECPYWRPSRKPKPFTLRERARRVDDQRKGEVGVDDPGRWDATIATVEAERDAYRWAVEAFLGDDTPEVCIERHERMATETRDQVEYERHCQIAGALRKTTWLA